jgi:predicted amidohydrolase
VKVVCFKKQAKILLNSNDAQYNSMNRKKPIVAVAAIRYFDIHTKHNLEKIKDFIHQAKRKKADIVCFPESCIIKHGALHITHKYIKAIQHECERNQIWAIITEDLIIKDKRYNISILIDREGKIRGKYKKIHLYGDMTYPGSKVRVFDTDFARIGIVICWDITYPKLFNIMKKKGAEIVFCPSQWHYEEKSNKRAHWKREVRLLRALVLARAHENIFFVVMSNPLTDAEDMVSYSAIACPHHVLREIVDKEGIITARLNLNEIHKFRKMYNKD